MPRTLPNLVIAGVAKGGTTSLFHYLGQHPDICASDLKELDYFAPLRRSGGVLAPVDEYARHFRHCAGQRYRMEASPSYCYAGRPVIGAIREVLGSPRIIISLREPVRRFWSAYTFLQSMGRLDPKLSCDEYIDQCIAEQTATGRPTPLSVGRYIEWLPDWLDEFATDLHLVFAEQLFESPSAVVGGVLEWLAIDETIVEVDDVTHNPTNAPRSHLVAKVAYRAKRVSDQMLASAPRARAALRKAYRGVNARVADRTMPAAVSSRLGAHYAGPTDQLAREFARRGIGQVPGWLGGPP